MPHNELCPGCGFLVPDWHWEWHREPEFSAIYRGAAGMECPACGAAVMHARAGVPLTLGQGIPRARRDVGKAAAWSRLANAGMSLEDYLATAAGKPYARLWTPAEVRQADQQAATSP
jgi:hypothetical protein